MSKRLQATPDSWKDIVGMPDDEDKRNITALIDTFMENTFEINLPDGRVLSWTGLRWIAFVTEQARDENHAIHGANTFNIKSEASHMRHVLTMPPPLQQKIKEAYPTMFRDPDHFAWFIKNFKAFLIADRY